MPSASLDFTEHIRTQRVSLRARYGGRRTGVSHSRASDAGAVRAFWVYLLVSVLIDALWLYQYSALQPFTWEQMQQMTRREQVAVALTAVNVLYKLVVVGVSVRLQMLLGAFEAAELQGDRPGLLPPPPHSRRMLPQRFDRGSFALLSRSRVVRL